MTKVIPDHLRRWHVYHLVDPRNDEPFYVGITYQPEDRYRTHVSNGRLDHTAKAERIRQIWADGEEVRLVIVETFDVREAALALEATMIRTLDGLTNEKPRTSLSDKFPDDALFLKAIAHRIEQCSGFSENMIKDQARLLGIIRKRESKGPI